MSAFRTDGIADDEVCSLRCNWIDADVTLYLSLNQSGPADTEEQRVRAAALGWLRGRLRIHAAFLHALKLSFTA